MTCFKNLKFVIVDGIQMWNSGYFYDPECPRYNSKPLLLSISDSVLLDSISALEADYFANLMYLDISGTYHAPAAIASLSHYEFGNLRVLKMRNMRLTKLPLFVLVLGPRLWSLDVSSNLLTDNAVDALISFCIKPAIGQPNPLPLPVPDADFFEPPPEYTVHGDVYDELPARRPDNTTLFVEEMLKNQNAVSNPLYALTGLTQLYISNNKLTADGISPLLGMTNRLQVLDLGAVLSSFNMSSYCSQHATAYHTHAPRLMPLSQLERIRVHHSFVTYIPTITLGSSTQYHTEYVDAAERFVAGYSLPDVIISYDPLRNHRITHLILTDIPTKSYGILIEYLIAFIRKVTKQSQDIEELRGYTRRHHRSPVFLSGLRLLRLEFMLEDGKNAPSSSVSGDKDADTFLERSMGDFSFFGEGKAGESSDRGEKDKKGKGKEKVVEEKKERVLRDVVTEIKAFREKEVPRWPGQLQLVFPARSGGD